MTPRKPDVAKDCEYCGSPLERVRHRNGRLQDYGAYLKRRFCDRACASRTQPRKQYAASMVRAVKYLYQDRKWTIEEISEETGYSPHVIRKVMINHGIPRRKRVKRNQWGAQEPHVERARALLHQPSPSSRAQAGKAKHL